MSGKYDYIIKGFLVFLLFSANLLATSKTTNPFITEIDYALSSATIKKPLSHAFDARAKDVQQHRKEELWEPLKLHIENKSIPGKKNKSFKAPLPKIHVLSTDDRTAPVIYRDRYSSKTGFIYYDPIYYHVYVSDLIKTRKIAPKGVIIHVYGGVVPMEKQNLSGTHEEVMYARDNYIVYALNPKGVNKKGEWFRTLQGRSGGLFSTIDDINYFSYLLKHSVSDVNDNLPMMHNSIIEGAPFFLCGSSMGGHVTLLIATADNKSLFVPHLGQDIVVHNIFDGFMPSMSITNVHDELLSGTRSSQLRLEYFKGSAWRGRKFDTWMKNAYTVHNPYLAERHNERFSPQYRASNIDRPVLLHHGLQDTNVSPEQSFNFHRACQEANTAQWVNVRYEPEIGHFNPSNFTETYDFYETVYTFMDRVRDGKLTNQPFTLSPKGLQLTASATDYASFLTRAHNKDLSTSYGLFLIDAVKNHLKYEGSIPDPHVAWRSYARGYSKQYYSMIAEFYVHTLLPLSHTYGPERLSYMDLRKVVLHNIMEELDLDDTHMNPKILKKELRHLHQFQITIEKKEHTEIMRSIPEKMSTIPIKSPLDSALIKTFSVTMQKRIKDLKINPSLNFGKTPHLTALMKRFGKGDCHLGLLCLSVFDTCLKTDYLELLNFMKTHASLCSIAFPSWNDLHNN